MKSPIIKRRHGIENKHYFDVEKPEHNLTPQIKAV